MKKTKYLLFSTGFSVLLTCPLLQANEFALYAGLGYSSLGLDVADFYESNVAVEVKGLPGLGGSFRFSYNMDNNIRIDIGTGNMVFMAGDLSYHSIPLNITGGYNFHFSDNLNLYTRAGLVYNIIDGDFVDSQDKTGFIAAAGLEYRSFFMEISGDSSKSEMSVSRGPFTTSTSIDGGFSFTIGAFF